MLYRGLLLLEVIVIMAGVTASSAAAEQQLYPIMAWDYADSEATLKAMSECGVNMVAFVPVEMLDACGKNGIRAIVYDRAVETSDWTKPFDPNTTGKALETLIRRVNGHPGVFGYHLKDEPDSNSFPGLAAGAAVVKKLAPGKWPYINLLPIHGPGYDKYIEDFCSICQPPILSYDMYPIGEDGGFNEGFWTHLATFRALGLRHNVPFYNIVLTVAHGNYRELSMTDLRIQIFGSLVYGCKGICYYKFSSRHIFQLGAFPLGNFRMGPLDEFGDKTQTWSWLRNINRQVTNMGPTLLKLRSDDVYFIGGAVPDQNHGPSAKSLVKSLPGDGKWIVGDFTHEDGSRWVMFVNRDMQFSRSVRADYNVPATNLEFLDPVTGKMDKLTAPEIYYLAPGQGVLVKVQYSSR